MTIAGCNSREDKRLVSVRQGNDRAKGLVRHRQYRSVESGHAEMGVDVRQSGKRHGNGPPADLDWTSKWHPIPL